MGGLGPCDPDLGSRVAVVSLVSLATVFSTELQEGEGCASHLPDLCGCLITSVRERTPFVLFRSAKMGPPQEGQDHPSLSSYISGSASIFSHILACC